MSWSGYDVLGWLSREQQTITSELAQFQVDRTLHARQLAEIEAETGAAWKHLLTLLLPDVTPASLDAAALRISLPSIGAAAVAERARAHRAELEATVAQVEATALFVAREAKANEISIRLAEIEDAAAPLRKEINELEALPSFSRLVSVGYGTAAYPNKWWQLWYYRDWKAADELVERCATAYAVADFGALRQRYLQHQGALRTLDGNAAELRATAEEIARLTRTHAQATTALADPHGWSLATARGLAREHLAGLPDATFRELFRDDAALRLAGERVSGTGAKRRYLEAMGSAWLVATEADVKRRLDKLKQAQAKINRSAKKLTASYDPDLIANKYRAPVDKWRERRQRYHATSTHIVTFHHYHVATYDPSWVWWDAMTGGRVSGNFIPEVAQAHQQGLVGDAFGSIAADRDADFGNLGVDAS